MKIEIELHDSQTERPTRSCDTIVFHRTGLNGVYSAADVHYSAKYDQFNNHDEFCRERKAYGESGKHRIFWAYFDEVKEAIRKAVNAERRKAK